MEFKVFDNMDDLESALSNEGYIESVKKASDIYAEMGEEIEKSIAAINEKHNSDLAKAIDMTNVYGELL